MNLATLNEPHIRQQKPGLTVDQYRLFENLGEYVAIIAAQEKVQIKHIEKFSKGRTSAVLLVTTPSDRFVLKISARNDIYSEIFFFERAKRHQIAVPAVFHSDISKQVIPFGFVFMEYIAGKNANDAPHPLQKQAAVQFGQELARLHTTPLTGFGAVNEQGEFSAKSWCGLLRESLRQAWQLADPEQRAFPQNEHEAMQQLLLGGKNVCAVFEPRLLHGDAGGNNCLVRLDKQGQCTGITMIDPGTWVGGDPMQDLAFSQIHWHYRGFSEGVWQGYTAEHPLSPAEQERFAILRVFNQYWGALMSYRRGWKQWYQTMQADYRKSLEELTPTDHTHA